MDEESTAVSLQARVQELEGKQNELLSTIEVRENEFGKKRAQFKEIFLQKETELNDEVTKLRIAREENAKLLADLQNVSAERDDLKTAVLIAETSSDDKETAMKFKYQEEIASLKAIMYDAVQDTRQDAKEKYEAEHMTLVVANQEQEKKLAKYKAQIRELKSKQQQQQQQQQQPLQEDSNDGLFDVLPRKQHASTPEPIAETDENLENSMKKAQEDAEALRSIVMPLEEEIASLKSKLRNANEKISVLETKQEKKSVKPSQSNHTHEMSRGNEAMEEKIKELSQYLEAERSARTDLEMFVAVLNTQKAVLQEDAEKLRKELHNVCRLLEQEKEEHIALKDTWGMANDRFLETQRVQRVEMDKIKKLLTTEQLQLLGEDPTDKKDTVELLTPPSPSSAKRFLNRKMNKGTNKKENIKARKSGSSEPRRSLASLVQRSPKSNSLPSTPSSILDSDVPQFESKITALLPNSLQPAVAVSSNSVDSDSKSLNAFSDGEATTVVNGGTMKKYKSADDLEAGLAPAAKGSLHTRSQELNFANELDSGVVKRGNENIDWKSFEEAAKSSLSDDVDRACAMCSNYEKQLQKLQQKNEALSEETSALSTRLKQERETVIVVKRTCDRLEQSVKVASEDAQAQIKVAMDTQRSFESLLDEITADIDKTKKETSKQVSELMVSRDSLFAQYEQLSENSRALQKLNFQHTEQKQAERAEDQTDLKTKELVALQSEINFMKDRVVAEQIGKESIEELYQAEIETLGLEIRNLKSQLGQQRQLENPPQATESKQVIGILEKQLQQSFKDKGDLETQVKQLKTQLYSLNGQLNNSEAVQRDFVKLSQSLQMKLEEMKESQKEIKWEHDDDVSSCRKCEKPLDVPQDKHHCRLCGRIFCDNCSSQTINNPSSPLPLRLCVDCGATEKTSDISGDNMGINRETDDT